MKNPRPENEYVSVWLPSIVAAAMLSWLAIIVVMRLFRGPVFVFDSKITQFGICLDDSGFSPVESVPASAGVFYVCGSVEGTTVRPGSLIIEGPTRPVYSANLTLPLGDFYQRIQITDAFVPGNYITSFGDARKTLAQAQFVIVNDW